MVGNSPKRTVGGGSSQDPNSMSPRSSPKRGEADDMLCPICDEACSCTGQTELRIHHTKPFKVAKRKSSTSHTKKSSTNKIPKVRSDSLKTKSHVTATARNTMSAANLAVRQTQVTFGMTPSLSDKEKRDADLAVQYALSEYYFSGDEDEDFDGPNGMMIMGGEKTDDSEVVAEYYGYSSGTDIAMDSLFMGSDSETYFDEDDEISSEHDDESDDLENGTILLTAVEQDKSDDESSEYSHEETLTEQLAKITPQILAAISVAAKHMNNTSTNNRDCNYSSHMYTYDDNNYNSTQKESNANLTLRLDEVFDTKKLSAAFFSTSPSTSRINSGTSVGEQSYWPPITQSTQSSTQLPITQQRKSVVPMDAFRRSRRNSHQHNISGALRNNTHASCTLSSAAPMSFEMDFEFTFEQNNSQDTRMPMVTVEWTDPHGEQNGDDEENGEEGSWTEEFDEMSTFSVDLFALSNRI